MTVEEKIKELLESMTTNVKEKFDVWYNKKNFLGIRKVKSLDIDSFEKAKELAINIYLFNKLSLELAKMRLDLKDKTKLKADVDKQIENTNNKIIKITQQNTWWAFLPFLKKVAKRNKNKKIAKEQEKLTNFETKSQKFETTIEAFNLGINLTQHKIYFYQKKTLNTPKDLDKVKKASFLKVSRKNKKVIDSEIKRLEEIENQRSNLRIEKRKTGNKKRQQDSNKGRVTKLDTLIAFLFEVAEPEKVNEWKEAIETNNKVYLSCNEDEKVPFLDKLEEKIIKDFIVAAKKYNRTIDDYYVTRNFYVHSLVGNEELKKIVKSWGELRTEFTLIPGQEGPLLDKMVKLVENMENQCIQFNQYEKIREKIDKAIVRDINMSTKDPKELEPMSKDKFDRFKKVNYNLILRPKIIVQQPKPKNTRGQSKPKFR